MKIYETGISIFDVPQGWELVGAFSADKQYTAGLPAAFNKVFDLNKKLEHTEDWNFKPGVCYCVSNLNMLIVKESTYDAPNKIALEDALMDLLIDVEEFGTNKLAMPKICTGKNGFEWDEILQLIKNTFDDTDVEIMVCTGS